MRHFFFFVSILLSLCLGMSPAFAQESASCDPAFRDVIYDRAKAEAQREMEIAITLIRQPDSVLEYSCFEQHGRFAASTENYLRANFAQPAPTGSNKPSTPCGLMNAVWENLKCENFNISLFDGFEDHIKAHAKNCTADFWKNIAIDPSGKIPAVLDDESVTGKLFEPFAPKSCSRLKPLYTGLIVERRDQTTYKDAVCPAPGCSYSGGRCK